ncbi:hypothetical protein GCM10010411_95170 [Actinomadura fulvescens]|uniref:Uncharacterized protein n=1 Tax=Actinomadura fulvescens TaxID=46160 RepID=A0ABN3R046_9ACTN
MEDRAVEGARGVWSNGDDRSALRVRRPGKTAGEPILHRNELWWDSEFSCASCGAYMCEDSGPGPAPDHVREALLTAHGPARLRLAGPVPSLVPALKVVREISATTLSRARELVEELSHEGLTGTLPEMEFLKARLQLRGVPVNLDR